jgi:hypothetical protein
MGNVIVSLSKENKESKSVAVGLAKFPVFSVAVKSVQSGQSITIDNRAVSYAAVLSDVKRGDYYVEIVWDKNLGTRSIAESATNLFNASEKINFSKDTKKIFNITATQMIPALPDLKETEFVKELKAPSALLSKFHGKPMTVAAAVLLPKEYYTDSSKKYLVLFVVSGCCGNYHRYSGTTIPSPAVDTIPIIELYLQGTCALGHSVYANSANNGSLWCYFNYRIHSASLKTVSICWCLIAKETQQQRLDCFLIAITLSNTM